MRPRVRLDQLMLERGLAGTTDRAQALLLAGQVRVGRGDAARRDRKPGDLVWADSAIEVALPAPFVSRGGQKLAAALDAFGVDPAGRVCLDVGASTGGFTDCLLQRGASRVYALDVGRGQFAEVLRADPRVVSLERTHVRRLLPDDPQPVRLPEMPSLAVADVSFISLAAVLPAIIAQLAPDGEVVALVKPQFEAGRGAAPDGLVRDPDVRQAAVASVAAAARALGWEVLGQMESPLVGPAGNHEWFVHLRGGRAERSAAVGPAMARARATEPPSAASPDS